MPQVRKPFRPIPGTAVGAGGDDRDTQMVRAVEGAQLRDHRPHEHPRRIPVAFDVDGRETTQVQCDRQGVHHRVGAHEAAQRHRRHRFEVFDRAGLWFLQASCQVLAAHADAYMSEIRIFGTPLPHAARTDRGGQGSGSGMRPFRSSSLRSTGVEDFFTSAVEVAQIVFAGFVQLCWPCSIAATVDEHCTHRHHHHQREHQHKRAAHHRRTHGEKQSQHAQHGDDHDDRHDPRNEVRGHRTRHFWGRVEWHLPTRHSGWGEPRSTHKSLGGHGFVPSQQVRSDAARRRAQSADTHG